MSTLGHAPYGQTETGAAYTEAAERYHPARLIGIAQVAMKQAIHLDDPTEAKRVLADALDRITPDSEWTVYTADCGECGGTGGHPVYGPQEWEDCPHCKPVEDCGLCGDAFDCKDRAAELLLIDGHPQPVCTPCAALELKEADE